MLPNLDAEQARCGYTEEFLAKKLGLTEKAYRFRKKSASFSLKDAVALAEICDKPVEYLFRLNSNLV